MATNTFARSAPADTDLLADDDPLSELARIVGYEPRPTAGTQIPSQPAPVARERQDPVFGLEDELMRAFELYDAPRLDPVDHVSAPETDIEPPAIAREELAEPAFEEPSVVDPAFADADVHDVHDGDFAAAEPVAIELEPLDFELSSFDGAASEPVVENAYTAPDVASVVAQEPAEVPVRREPVFLGLQPEGVDNDIFDVPAIDLEQELELSIGDGLSSDHTGQDEGVGQDWIAEPAQEEIPAYEPEAQWPETQTVDDAPSPDVVFPVDESSQPVLHELHAQADASFAEALPVSADISPLAADPQPDAWSGQLDAVSAGDAPEPFQADLAYGEVQPHFDAPDDRTFHETDMGETDTGWAEGEAATLPEVGFEAQQAYDVAPVAAGAGNDYLDDLLAEVENFPVPVQRPPLSSAPDLSRAATIGSLTPVVPVFGRATPVAAAKAHEKEAPVAVPEAPIQPVADAAAPEAVPVETASDAAVSAAPSVEVGDLDFENFELDLSDMDFELELDDLSLDEDTGPEPTPVAAADTAPATPADISAPVAPAAAVSEAPDVVEALPFDPSMIAAIEENVAPVSELDVPHLPATEKEKPPAYQPDYDYDIDSEMAQLFAEPAGGGGAGEAVTAGVAGVASSGFATETDGGSDEFERALEEDFRRSLNQPERMAIPIDPTQSGEPYRGDGYDEPAPRGKGLLIAACLGGVLLLGGAGVYAWTSMAGGAAGSGEPRVILADRDPVKIVPEERGGTSVPNQDKAVYDRVAGASEEAPQQDQLVTTTEEPVDVVQRTLAPETLPLEGFDGESDFAGLSDDDSRLLPGVDEPLAADGQDDRAPVVSPRRVRTMIVRPDGTLVAREETVAEPAAGVAQTPAVADLPAVASGGATTAQPSLAEDASLRTEQAAASEPSRLAEAADAEVEETAPVRMVRTTTFGANGTTDGNAPVPVARPADQPVAVVGTVTDQGNVSGAASGQAAAVESAAQAPAAQTTEVAAVSNPGGYVIQIASLPSEAEAQQSYNSLSARFSGVIGGRGVDIRRAEIPDRGTFYRVRIPAGSREEANALCNRYKNAGGSCLVTR